jgi:hypothetical protein
MKILILTKDLTNEEVILAKQAMAKVKTLLPQLEFFYQTTNATFRSIASGGSDLSVNGFVLDASQILPLVSGDFDIACLIYNADSLTPRPTNPASSNIKKGNCIPFAIPSFWYNGYVDVLVEFYLHEQLHCEYFRAGKKDLTHSKYDPMWNNQWGQKSNIDYYLFLLKRFIQPIVILTRNSDNGIETLGTLTYGNFTCKTLERPNKGNQPNISCIPVGTYTCKYTFSFKFLKYTYELQNVPNRSGIRIHSANLYSQLLGCIALGDSYSDINADKQLDILNSRATITAFENLMNKQPFQLIIK